MALFQAQADFIASDYCREKETTSALARPDKREAVVVPVILRDIGWSSALRAKLQALPKDALPIMLWPDKGSAW